MQIRQKYAMQINTAVAEVVIDAIAITNENKSNLVENFNSQLLPLDVHKKIKQFPNTAKLYIK